MSREGHPVANDNHILPVDYHVFKTALNNYLGRHCGGSSRPAYHDVEKSYPALQAVTASFPAIRAEFDRLVADQVALPTYHDIDQGEAKISSVTPAQWSVFMLELLGHRPEVNRARCPETCQVLERVPGLVQAFFSVLDPHKSVPEHDGPYLGYLRYHLGLSIPRVNPPTLIVKGQRHVWKEGEGILFDDSWPHAVENHSPETRAVLIIDVMRPLPFLPRQVNRFFMWIARHTYGRKVARKVQEFAAEQPAAPARHAA
jgi:aspartyl/asparaginyl beta-hydroxylase (cupin superfamily)